MFDTYIPAHDLRCPACQAQLNSWQGKDGPCALLVWKEGRTNPVQQDADDKNSGSAAQLSESRLPSHFLIYSHDCPRHQPIEALGASSNGTWTKTELLRYRSGPRVLAEPWVTADRSLSSYVRFKRARPIVTAMRSLAAQLSSHPDFQRVTPRVFHVSLALRVSEAKRAVGVSYISRRCFEVYWIDPGFELIGSIRVHPAAVVDALRSRVSELERTRDRGDAVVGRPH